MVHLYPKNRVENFAPDDVCPNQGNNEHGVACTIDLIFLMRFVCSSSIHKQ